jgi:arabinose operon protein AraL
LPNPPLPPHSLYEAYLLDFDGTLYFRDEWLPGALDTLLELNRLGKRLVFLTNDATHPRAYFARKLTHMGFPIHTHQVINSSYVMITYLQERFPGERLFVIGEPSLRRELRKAGFQLCNESDHVVAVVASSDFHFNYRKLKAAFNAIRNGALFLATNADTTYPLADGVEEPDTGATIAALEACTRHPLDVMVGKPSTYMAQAALQLLGLPAEKCLLVGDNLETDIRMGRAAGISTALVLTGITREAQLAGAQIQPDYTLKNMSDLLP